MQDLRFAIRSLRATRAVTAVAIVTLALGIGFDAIDASGGRANRTGTPAAQPEPANREMRVAILVDTSAGTSVAFNLVRTSVDAFVDGLPAGPEVLLVSTGRRTQVRVPPTTDRKKIRDSVNGLTADGGATPLIDALREVDERFMRKADDRWPVFVILTGDGSESSLNSGGDSFTAWLRTLPARRVSAHAVVLKTGNGAPETIARAVAQATGGQFETVGNAGLLRGKMQALAERISRDRERAQR